MITEAPLYGRIDVRLPGVTAPSKYGDNVYGAGRYGGTGSTLSVLADSTQVTIRRGGVRDGLGVKTDVGLMTFLVKDAHDPMNGGTLRVGQTVEMVVGEVPIFTGRIAFFGTTYILDKASNTTRAMTSVTVADAVNVHVSTMRYGRDIEEGFETFESRISAYASSANAPIEVPVIGAPKVVYSF